MQLVNRDLDHLIKNMFYFTFKKVMHTVTSESNRIKTFIVPPLKEFIFYGYEFL